MNTISSPSVPRIESLHHRLLTAKGPDGEPLGLLDDLMVFLEDPPTDIHDRWKAGVELCAEHGIVTSRAAVWRFYRAYVVQWRYENAPPIGKISEKSTAKLAEQARHLLSLRAAESLHHPHLAPHVLVGLVHNENRRQELQLARDKFNEQLFLRQREDEERRIMALRKAADNAAFQAAWAKTMGGGSFQKFQHALEAEKAAKAAQPAPSASGVRPAKPSQPVSPGLT